MWSLARSPSAAAWPCAFVLPPSSRGLPFTCLRTNVLGHDPVQCVAHVFPDVLVVIFVHAQGAARVLDEEVEEPAFYVADCGDGGGDVLGD